MLEQTTQGILRREDVLGGAVDLRVMAGNIANISKEARMESSDALLQFIRCTFHIKTWAMGLQFVHQINVIIIWLVVIIVKDEQCIYVHVVK